MSRIFVVTHGERHYGPNPNLTNGGCQQIIGLREKVAAIKPLELVVVGTGARFSDTYALLANILAGIPMKRSPFCGSGDAQEKNGSIVLSTGAPVPADDYLGLTTPGFDAWKFIRHLPDGTLLCAGGELMAALGFFSKKGKLYQLDTDSCGCREFVTGQL